MIGIDEVGRGCWAGPLVLAGVVMTNSVEGLRDSKKLSAKKRAELEKVILAKADWYHIVEIAPAIIDEVGLTEATIIACREIFSSFSQPNVAIVIDGNINYLEGIASNSQAIIGADDSVKEAMAASIIAKEYRDKKMRELAKEFPDYGFDAHVGYGTKQHAEALAQHGITPHHRLSFRPVAKYVSGSREES